VVAVGFSAGGYLALWLGNRSALPRASELYTARPLPLRGVVALGASGDVTPLGPVMIELCETDVLKELFTGDSATVRTRTAQGNPSDMPPSRVPQRLIVGDKDEFVSPADLETYVARARAKAEPIEATTVPGANHGDLGSPKSATWPIIRAVVLALLGGAP
jgi:fermentation-respiration switch protein FrsA (DUF1100 family)